ncbi:Arm DNA-binding domain-containing protein [Lentilactobacillus senioris]|uniref:Arm DNA-binding domain-containing protein n=1 Tax=Lentilactobacillus senioris TaxID=931534 RepID=UPI002280E8AE|nr:Arm DNA-binding domain-containing protein [Lentilactobacillus senioris]MCY9807007.1 Arm DNA-binding domain-containing protein [Lentilactobacillus senioris]
MAITKNGNKYTVRISYKDKQGKYRSKQKDGFKSRREAELFASKMLMELNEGHDLNPDITSFYDFFVDWYKTYKELKLSNQTKSRYRITANELKKYFGDTPISQINRRIYQKFINHYGSTHAKNTVHKVNSLVRACVRSALLDDILKKDFTAEVVLTYNE